MTSAYGDMWPKDEAYLIRLVQSLQQQVQQLQAASVLESASIGAGGLQVIDGGSVKVFDPSSGRTTAILGSVPINDGSGRTNMVTYLFRDDGTPALQLGDLGTVPGHSHQQALQWFDRSSTIVFADDTTSGSGIATPYTQEGNFVDITSPTNTTTSTAFTAMQWADVYQQHPRITASVLVQTPSGTTGQIRMTIGGVQIGSAVSIPSATFQQMTIATAAWPSGSYAWQQRVVVQLEAKVVSGAGAIGVRGMSLWGVQS